MEPNQETLEPQWRLLGEASPSVSLRIPGSLCPSGNTLGVAIGKVLSSEKPTIICLPLDDGTTMECLVTPVPGTEKVLILGRNQPQSSTAPGAISHEPSSTAEQPAVLVVDDNDVNLTVIKGFLQKLEVPCDLASGGAEAVELFRQKRHPIIIMDCQMPGMNGFDATRRIRQMVREGESQPRIIALTAELIDLKDRQRCFDSGMNDCITKPLRFNELREILGQRESAGPAGSRQPQPAQEEDRVILDHKILREIRELSGGGNTLLKTMVERYREDGSSRLQQLEAAVQTGDSGKIGSLAHSLKGSSVILGANRAASVCKELESLGKTGDMDNIRKVLSRVHHEYQEALTALAGELK